MLTQDDSYGLLDAQSNIFYAVSQDYHAIKIMQMLLLNNKLFPCVNLSRLSADHVNMSNCVEFGVSKPLTKFLNPDPDTSMYGAKVVETSGKFHPVLKENIKALLTLVNRVEGFVDDFEDRERARFRDMLTGLNETKEFVIDMIPEDPNIEEFVDREMAAKEKMIYRAREIRNSLFKGLMSIDYWNPISNDLEDHIRSLESVDQDLVRSFKLMCLKCR